MCFYLIWFFFYLKKYPFLANLPFQERNDKENKKMAIDTDFVTNLFKPRNHQTKTHRLGYHQFEKFVAELFIKLKYRGTNKKN